MENGRICQDEKTKANQLEQTIELKEINQKVLMKEDIVKRNRDRIERYRQKRTF